MPEKCGKYSNLLVELVFCVHPLWHLSPHVRNKRCHNFTMCVVRLSAPSSHVPGWRKYPCRSTALPYVNMSFSIGQEAVSLFRQITIAFSNAIGILSAKYSATRLHTTIRAL